MIHLALILMFPIPISCWCPSSRSKYELCKVWYYFSTHLMPQGWLSIIFFSKLTVNNCEFNYNHFPLFWYLLFGKQIIIIMHGTCSVLLFFILDIKRKKMDTSLLLKIEIKTLNFLSKHFYFF